MPESSAAEAEIPSPRSFSFLESADFLREHGIDLLKAREEDAEMMVRWGALERDAVDEYMRTFECNFDPVPEADLREFVRRRQENPGLEQLVILGVNAVPPGKIFEQVSRRLSHYTRVDATGKPLEDQALSGKAGILFTPGDRMPSSIGDPRCSVVKKSANDELAEMASGRKFVGPIGWMKIFLRSLEEALYKLDPRRVSEERQKVSWYPPGQYAEFMFQQLAAVRHSGSFFHDYLPEMAQFPDLRHPNNDVAFLKFDPSQDYCDWADLLKYNANPDLPYARLGAREALGTFLS